mmetsp:Transcript_88035/g.146415  ORF Transcript_88035/g.146415 Transcript_88035/m.146415 type:complete len:288 (-) Transcript_88035:59-922(-)
MRSLSPSNVSSRGLTVLAGKGQMATSRRAPVAMHPNCVTGVEKKPSVHKPRSVRRSGQRSNQKGRLQDARMHSIRSSRDRNSCAHSGCRSPTWPSSQPTTFSSPTPTAPDRSLMISSALLGRRVSSSFSRSSRSRKRVPFSRQSALMRMAASSTSSGDNVPTPMTPATMAPPDAPVTGVSALMYPRRFNVVAAPNRYGNARPEGENAKPRSGTLAAGAVSTGSCVLTERPSAAAMAQDEGSFNGRRHSVAERRVLRFQTRKATRAPATAATATTAKSAQGRAGARGA